MSRCKSNVSDITSPTWEPSFSKDTAIKTGQSERNIQLSTQRAENLIPEAKSILRGKEITKTEATLLAKEEPTQQKRIIQDRDE